MGPTILSFVGRSSLSRRSNKVLAHGIETNVLCREVVPISEGPISEVLLLYYYTSVRKVMMLAQLYGITLSSSECY